MQGCSYGLVLKGGRKVSMKEGREKGNGTFFISKD
jgi:hypothetical protein